MNSLNDSLKLRQSKNGLSMGLIVNSLNDSLKILIDFKKTVLILIP